MKIPSLSILAIVLAMFTVAAQGQAPGTEQKLREQLKSVMGQLKTAETDKAAALVDKADLEAKLAAGKKTFEDLAKQAAADKEAAAKEHEKLTGEIAAAKAETARLTDLLTKSDTAGKLSAALATKTKADLDKSVANGIQLKRIVEEQRTRNNKMHEIAMEILDRYEKFGLGTALTAREPFVGITRARLETMVEESTSAVDAQRIRIGGGSVPGSAAPATATPANPKDRPADGKPGTKKAATKP